MIEKHFFADADTPFHVWVRERCGTQGYRWVLRHVSHVIEALGAPGMAGLLQTEQPVALRRQ